MLFRLSEEEKQALRYLSEHHPATPDEIYKGAGLAVDPKNKLIRSLVWRNYIQKWGSHYYLTKKGEESL